MGNGAKERPALINGSKERLAFQIAEDERKERVECRASVDLSKHEGMYRKDLEVGWDLHGRPHDICGIKAGLYLCLAAVREGVNGGRAEQNAASSSRSAFRTLDVAAIGQRYNPADEGSCWKCPKAREWEALIGASTRRGGQASRAWIWPVCDRGHDWGPDAAQMQCLGICHMLHNLF